jgi:hypothetical protein
MIVDSPHPPLSPEGRVRGHSEIEKEGEAG